VEVTPPRDVLAYYEIGLEGERLSRGAGALERERTQELLARFLPPAPADVADIGGATGVHASLLAEAGHRVELVDPVALHLDLARELAGDPERFGVWFADARALPFDDETFDAVLLLGPLYHLGERSDRLGALAEAVRIARPGAVVAGAAIGRHAPLLDTLRRGRAGDAQVFANVQAETESGRRVEHGRRTSPFPDAYFHLPGELEGELRAAGLDVLGVFGIEGPGWLHADLDEAWDDPAVRERLLWAARLCERDPALLALSAHLLGVGVKPA
jgi:SAM-dependent methyltransferase